MSIHSLIARTAKQHASLIERRAEERAQAVQAAALEKAREQWLNALLVDQTRAWLSLGEVDQGALQGLATVLALAGMVHAYEHPGPETVEVRIILGAVSAIEQAGNAGSVIAPETAGAFVAACRHAEAIIRNASHAAILYAASTLRAEVGAA